MDVIKVIQVLLRRWLVVLPVLLLGAAGTAYTVSNIPDEYSVTGSMIVVDTSTGSGETTPGILAEVLQDGATRAAVAAVTGSSTYAVQADSGGILRVTATAADGDAAAATANAVLDQMSVVLQQRAEAAGRDAPSAQLEVLNRATDESVVVVEGGATASASARFIEAPGAAFGGERATRLLAQALSTTTVRQQVVADGGVGTYTLNTSRDLPTLTINVSGTDEVGVLTTVDLLIAEADAQLDSLSVIAGAQPGSVAVEPLVLPDGVVVNSTGVFRSIVGLLALTAAVGVAAAFTVEAVVEHRRRVRSELPPRPSKAVASRQRAIAGRVGPGTPGEVDERHDGADDPGRATAGAVGVVDDAVDRTARPPARNGAAAPISPERDSRESRPAPGGPPFDEEGPRTTAAPASQR